MEKYEVFFRAPLFICSEDRLLRCPDMSELRFLCSIRIALWLFTTINRSALWIAVPGSMRIPLEQGGGDVRYHPEPLSSEG